MLVIAVIAWLITAWLITAWLTAVIGHDKDEGGGDNRDSIVANHAVIMVDNSVVDNSMVDCRDRTVTATR